MLKKAQQLRRPFILLAVFGWISYVFVVNGIAMGIIVTSMAILFASTMES